MDKRRRAKKNEMDCEVKDAKRWMRWMTSRVMVIFTTSTGLYMLCWEVAQIC